MRMDRYDENLKNNVDQPLSRIEKNKEIYNNAYDNSAIVDIDNFFDNKEEENESFDDNLNEVSKITYEEKNYDIDDYLKKAHERITPDEDIRDLNNQDFKKQEDEISKLIASIDEQNDNDDFFSELIGDDENTIIEGQLETEEYSKTTLYTNTVETKLEKVLGNETMTKLKLEEDEINNTFQDIFKTNKKSKRKKRKIAITIFSISLFALIAVILIIIFK